MARPTLDDPDFDEFNAWARWVEEHDDVGQGDQGRRLFRGTAAAAQWRQSGGGLA